MCLTFVMFRSDNCNKYAFYFLVFLVCETYTLYCFEFRDAELFEQLFNFIAQCWLNFVQDKFRFNWYRQQEEGQKTRQEQIYFQNCAILWMKLEDKNEIKRLKCLLVPRLGTMEKNYNHKVIYLLLWSSQIMYTICWQLVEIVENVIQ